MRHASPLTRWYAITIISSGGLMAALLAWQSWTWSPPLLVWLALFTLIYALVDFYAVELPFRTTQYASISLLEAPTLFGIVVIGAPGIVAVILATLVVTWGIQRFPLRDVLMITGRRCVVYATVLAGAITIGQGAAARSGVGWLVAAVVLLALYTLVYTIASTLHDSCCNQQPALTNLRASWHQGEWISLIPAAMGLIAGRLFQIDAALLVFFLVPLGVAYAALRAVARALAAQEQARRLAEALHVAEEITTLKTRLLANVSHDLKSPATALVGMAHRISSPRYGPLSDTQQQIAASIVRNGQHLLHLIDDLVDLATLESGQLTLHVVPLALRPLVDDSLLLAEAYRDQQYPERRRSLTFALTAPAPLPYVRADERRVRQVLNNLLTNAVKFTPQGTISVVVHADHTTVTVLVRDTGMGIAPEHQSGLFVAFRPLDDSLARSAQRGSGLGLAICRQLIDLHGGQIWLNSTPGVGTTVGFTLPRTLDSVEHARAQAAAVAVLPSEST